MGYSGGEINKKHLAFNRNALEKGNKLFKYEVFNSTLRQYIGIIHFRGGFRQYVFQAYDKVDMTRGCNLEVNTFIDKLMKEWRDSLKKKREDEINIK